MTRGRRKAYEKEGMRRRNERGRSRMEKDVKQNSKGEVKERSE